MDVGGVGVHRGKQCWVIKRPFFIRNRPGAGKKTTALFGCILKGGPEKSNRCVHERLDQ